MTGIKVYIGPTEYPVTGQSVAFGILKYHGKSNEFFLHYPNKINVIVFYNFFIHLIKLLISRNSKVVYLSISRSRIGFLRDFAIMVLAKICRVSVICHLHGADLKNFYINETIIFRMIIYCAYRFMVSGMIVLTKRMQQELVYPIKCKVIPNAVSPEFETYFSQRHQKCYCKNNKLNLAFISNLIETKGILVLLDVVEKLASHDLQLNIYGSKGYSNKVDARMLELGANVFYHGVVTDDKKNEAFAEADIIILPTFYPTEAQPICLIEGMYSGCAVIFTDHSYLADFFPQDAGRCIAPRNGAMLEDAIFEFLNSKQHLENSGAKGLSFAKHNCTSLGHANQVRAFIETWL